MRAGFKLEPGVGALANDAQDDFPVTLQAALGGAHGLDPPAARLGIASIHAPQIGREQGGLLAARAGPYFEKDIAVIGRVHRQQKQLQFPQKPLAPGLGGLQFRCRQGLQLPVFVMQQLARRLDLPPGLLQGVITGHERARPGVFRGQRAEFWLVVDGLRQAQQAVQFPLAFQQLFQFEL